MKQVILLKYGEFILKGLNRSFFEGKLISNIKKSIGKEHRITKAQSTLYVEPSDGTDTDLLAQKLTRVFGISSVCVSFETDKDIESICQTAVSIAGKSFFKSFKVEAKRSDKKFELNSPQIAKTVGEKVLKAFCEKGVTVDVHNPDIILFVEVRDFGAYVYSEKLEGASGMPYGCSGKAVALLSGGIDSPVAAFMMAKRGLSLDLIHFFSPPYTGEPAKEKVIDIVKALCPYIGGSKLHLVNFTDMQLMIKEKCKGQYMTIIMRRMMMRIASKICCSVNARAIITGESLGQVASQTLSGLSVTEEASSFPVFRPLIGLDKEEIIEISRKIGTFDISVRPFEDCCTIFNPKHPCTAPQLEKILNEESKFPVDDILHSVYENIDTKIF